MLAAVRCTRSPLCSRAWRRTGARSHRAAAHHHRLTLHRLPPPARLCQAEEGTITSKIYNFGKRMLENIPAEERLMRGIPKDIDKVGARAGG
jgi:hypothetical protein